MTRSDYSTTRRLMAEKPACFEIQVDGLQTLLKTPDSKQKIAEGGLRLKGKYKTNSDETPLITVVTVVYNGAEFLEETINSVIEQTYQNVEYIIVDGGSTDGTLEIIRKYEHSIDYWVSEADKGIYDAMNKGIDLGSGQWINFMNAGDFFIDAGVLHEVFYTPEKIKNVDVIYGDHKVRYSHKTKVVRAGLVKNLWKGSQFCHQSSIVFLANHKKYKFNLCRTIAADFEFFYTSHLSGAIMVRVPLVISSVSSGGLSDVSRLKSILERWLVVEDKFYINLKYFFIIARELLRTIVLKLARIS